MCGLTGFIDASGTRSAESNRAALELMTTQIRHRGPDDSGYWQDAEAGIYLGHRRLSILDLSPEGHQPMASRCGRFIIVFNGEIYNYREIRSDVEAAGGGYAWRGHSDTEVMLAAICHWGLRSALERFNGMFAFALWDRKERVLHLARDRLGEKPLYYGWMGRTLLFGSELKALRAHPSWMGEIDRDVLALFMRHNYVPAPYSVYHQIRKLPPGTYLSLRHDAGSSAEGQPQHYWSAQLIAEAGSERHGEPADVAAATDQLDNLLRDAVALRMEADVPLGAFLSGGIDSTTVVAMMQAQSQRPVQTFSIGFLEGGYDEASYARQVARHLGTNHTELYVRAADAMAVIPMLPTLYDEPFADSSQIPTYLVSHLARRKVTVALSGDGGDELFGGYNRYFWGLRTWGLIGRIPLRVRHGIAGALRSIRPARWDSAVDALGRVVPRESLVRLPGDKAHKLADVLATPGAAEFYLGLVSHWSDRDAIVLGANEPRTLLRESRPAAVSDYLHDMMFKDLVTYLPDDILVKVDRASMGVSLEARVPLLDHRVVEFAWTLPASLKVRQGKGKWLLKQVLYRYVPQHMMERAKMGFGVPIDVWLRGPLREWAEDLLSEKRIRNDGLLDPAMVQTRWKEHLGGRRNWQYHLWDVLMLNSWLDCQRMSVSGVPPIAPRLVHA